MEASRKKIFIGILLQALFIGYYIYQIIHYNGVNDKLFITYIVFASVEAAYLIYCIIVLIIGKNPNNDLWVVLRLINYGLKVATIIINLVDLFSNNNEFLVIFGGIAFNILLFIILLLQILVDSFMLLLRVLENDDTKDKKIGIGVLWFIFNPAMILLYSYYTARVYNGFNWIVVLNIIVALMFVFNLFLFLKNSWLSVFFIFIAFVVGIINYFNYANMPSWELWIHIPVSVLLFATGIVTGFKKLFV